MDISLILKLNIICTVLCCNVRLSINKTKGGDFMIINTIKIKCLENTGNKMVGLCSLTFDGLVAVHGIKILKKDDRMFLAMPSRRTNAGTFKDIFHPISTEPREKIEQIIFDLYEWMLKRRILNQEFQYIDSECCSFLEQMSDRFEAVESKTYTNFVNDDIRKEIESWISD